MSETLTNTQIIIKDDNGQIHTSKSLGQQDETRLNNMVKLMNLILQTPNSTDFINTLASKAYVDSEVNNISSDLNGKADKDFTNIDNTAKIAIAHNAMPSAVYDDLTLGSTGTAYTAPADGYIAFSKTASASGQYILIHVYNEGNVVYSVNNFSSGGNPLRITVPIKKDQRFQVSYTTGGATLLFRFIYAVGSESEQS